MQLRAVYDGMHKVSCQLTFARPQHMLPPKRHRLLTGPRGVGPSRGPGPLKRICFIVQYFSYHIFFRTPPVLEDFFSFLLLHNAF